MFLFCYSDILVYYYKNVSHSVSLFSILFYYLLFVIIKRRISLSSAFLSAIILVNIVFICLFVFLVNTSPFLTLLSGSVFSFQQANEALHHQHHVAPNSLLPLLNSEPQDQKPVMPIPLDHKPPVSVAELLKDNVASGTGGGGGGNAGGGGPMPVVKKEHKSKTPFICGYCNKAFRDSYHLRRHESCHTGIKMVSRPKKTAQAAPTMVSLISTMPRETTGNPAYISTIAGIFSTATTSTSSASTVMSPMSMSNVTQHSAPKKPPKPVKKNHGCEMCGKAFRDVYHLNRHKLSHSDEKPFECPICQQRFKRKDRMTYHVRSHDGGVHKPYICSVCGKGFSRYVELLHLFKFNLCDLFLNYDL